PANWFDWQRMSQSFESLAAWNSTQATLTGQGDPELLNGQVASKEFFPLLRVTPLLGRMFRPEDDVPKAPHVVVLSHRLWQRRFGGDPNIIGRKIDLESEPYEIIGVAPADFFYYSPTVEFWMPYALDRNLDWRGTRGRSMPGVLGR